MLMNKIIEKVVLLDSARILRVDLGILVFCFLSGSLCVSERAVQVISRCHLQNETLLANNLQAGITVA